MPRGLDGPGEDGLTELLLWETLTDPLRNLNLATRYNLLVVGAACFSLGIILDSKGARPAPYTALIAFDTPVAESSLFDAMKELYWCLLDGNTGSVTSLDKAFESAARDLRFPERENMQLVTMIDHGRTAIRRMVRDRLQGEGLLTHSLDIGVAALRANQLSLSTLPYSNALVRSLEVAKRACNQAWATWFAFEQISENKQRFSIDVDALIEDELNEARKP